MIKPLSFKITFPAFTGAIQKIDSANNIRHNERHWIGDRPVNMRFGSKMQNTIELIFREQRIYESGVINIALYKFVIRFGINIFEVLKVARISKYLSLIHISEPTRLGMISY